MIKNIFIPEKIGSYYIFPQRILGFDIGKTHVYATQIYVHRSQVTIEKFFQEHIESDASIEISERISKALQTIQKEAHPNAHIVSSIASSQVVFKELTLPFTDQAKIRMVLGFEIESSLPFSLHEAVYDFIITHSTESESTLLVAAVQKKYIAEHLSYFAKAGLELSKISVDLFDLYSLYKSIPEYASSTQNVALIDIGYHTTRIAMLIEGQLTYVRSFPQGIMKIAKQISTLLSNSTNEVLETLVRFGFEQPSNPAYTEAAHQALQDYWSTVDFTLQTFLRQANQKKVDTILLLGQGAELQHAPEHIKKISSTNCSQFNCASLLKTTTVTLKPHEIPRTHILSLATAYPTLLVQDFNLRRDEFSVSTTKLFALQLITTASLMFLILGLLIFHTYWQVSTLKREAASSERAALTHIRSLDLSSARDLTAALQESAEKVTNEEDIWFAFSGQTRTSFLKYLQDLSTNIDRESLGLNIKNLIITERDVTIEGEVKSFDALKIFEKELRKSNLFVAIPALQETKFSMKLKLKNNTQEAL